MQPMPAEVDGFDKYGRDKAPDARLVTLADGGPLYHAFLNNPDSPVMDKNDNHQARERAEYYLTKYPQEVMKCQGLDAEQVRATLEALEEVKH